MIMTIYIMQLLYTVSATKSTELQMHCQTQRNTCAIYMTSHIYFKISELGPNVFILLQSHVCILALCYPAPTVWMGLNHKVCVVPY